MEDKKHNCKSRAKLNKGHDYRLQLMLARGRLRDGKVIEAYDILGKVLEKMEGGKDEDNSD